MERRKGSNPTQSLQKKISGQLRICSVNCPLLANNDKTCRDLVNVKWCETQILELGKKQRAKRKNLRKILFAANFLAFLPFVLQFPFN